MKLEAMKALSLWQPWATLSALGLKGIETRPRPYHHRGPLAIHATKSRPREVQGLEYLDEFWEALAPIFAELPPWLEGWELPTGAVVGTVVIEKCVPIEELFGTEHDTPRERAFGDWTPGRYGIIMREPVTFDSPVKVAGKQGLWTWTPPPDFRC